MRHHVRPRCDGCKNCNYLSLSLEWRDCSWFRSCDLNQTKVEGFRSLAWPGVRAAPSLRAAVLAQAGPLGAPSPAAHDESRDGREVCRPIEVERRKRSYGFTGFHWIAPLRVWLYEVPKSGSTTVMKMFKIPHGADDRPKRPPQPGDVAVAVVRHPLCRALSGFREAYERAAYRANTSRSGCPFSRFPYLLEANTSSAQHRLSVALRTLSQRGSALATADCGFAYHHMLSQAYFLWPERTHLPPGMHLPPVTRLLRLESLEEDVRALCAERGVAGHYPSDFCGRLLRRGVPHANKGNDFNASAKKGIAQKGRSATDANGLAARAFAGLEPHLLSPEVHAELLDYYSTDFDCLNYSRTDLPDC